MSAKKIRRGLVLGLLAVTVGGGAAGVAHSTPQAQSAKKAEALEVVRTPVVESYSLLETGWE